MDKWSRPIKTIFQPLIPTHTKNDFISKILDQNISKHIKPAYPHTHTTQRHNVYWRKFRSQTSDNMDRWKSRGGKSQRGEAKKWEEQRRERVRRKKMQVRKKTRKSPSTVFFQWFVALEGRKVGSLKQRVRSAAEPAGRWEMKNCTPLRRETHFEVKMYKTPQHRSTFGSWDVEKVHTAVARSTFPSKNVKTHNIQITFESWNVKKNHAVVARNTFPSQNVQSTPRSAHFWKFRCWKSRHCGAKHISKSKV